MTDERTGPMAGLVEPLGERMAASELESLELAWTRRRASARSPSELRAQARRDRLFAPSAADAQTLHAIDAQAFAALPEGFDANYAPLCFHVDVGGFPFGVAPLADGGEVGWTGALLGDRSQRLFTSGIGTELIATQLPAR